MVSNWYQVLSWRLMLFQVQDLKISGQAFEGTSVDGSFTLKGVILEKIPPLAFNFDEVGEFDIVNSKFERIPMWGFKVPIYLLFLKKWAIPASSYLFSSFQYS